MKKGITEKRKNLIHMTMNGEYGLLPIMHQLTRYVDCDRFLNWLINNRLTGRDLLEWINTHHNKSVLGMVQFIIKHSEKNNEVKPIILNKDWIG